MSDEIELHLHDLAGEGQRVSTGFFTVDVAREVEKLGPIVKQEPAAIVYWLVQGAVALGASRIQVRLLKEVIEVLVSLPEVPVELAQLEGFEAAPAASVESLAGQGLERLRKAVLWSRSLLKSKPDLEVSFEAQSERGTRSLVFRGDSANSSAPLANPPGGTAGGGHCRWRIYARRESSPVPSTEPAASPDPPQKGRDPQALLAVRVLRMALAADLPWRTAACPVPIWLDGRLLNVQGAAFGFDNGENQSSSAKPFQAYQCPALYHCYYLGPHGRVPMTCRSPLLLPALSYRVKDSLCSRPRFSSPSFVVERMEFAGLIGPEAEVKAAGGGCELIRWTSDDSPEAVAISLAGVTEVGSGDTWAARATISRFHAGPSLVCLVSLGLVVAFKPIETPSAGWLALIQCDRLQTDASGLNPVENRVYLELTEWVRQEILAVQSRMAAELKDSVATRLV